MASNKEQPWILGLVSGIMALIGLVLPVTFSIIDDVLVGSWLWGLVFGAYGGVSVTVMANDPIGVACTLIILVAGILTLLTANAARNRGTSPKLGLLWVFCGIAVLGSYIFYFIMQIDLFLISDYNIGLYIFLLSSILLITAGALLTRERMPVSGDTSEVEYARKERTFHQKKYRCVRCGYKTSKLAFQPTECLECEGTVFQVL